MSTCPGLTLERFLMWNYDLIVNGDASANKSLAIVEALGKPTYRRALTAEQFAPVVALFEPYRDRIEDALGDYDEDQSWRDYASVVAERAPDDVYEHGGKIIHAVLEGA